jgi:hypothetical protein
MVLLSGAASPTTIVDVDGAEKVLLRNLLSR